MKNLILNTVRIRPSRTEQTCVELLSPQGLLWIKDETGGFYSGRTGYHHIFTNKDTQEDVYTNSAKPMIESFLSGNNTAILTYGQVSSELYCV